MCTKDGFKYLNENLNFKDFFGSLLRTKVEQGPVSKFKAFFRGGMQQSELGRFLPCFVVSGISWLPRDLEINQATR